MAFAKLSGSLLASNDAPAVRALAEQASASRIVPGPAPGRGDGVPANEAGGGQDVPEPAEVAQLYGVLRDCIAANDQGGVSRVFAQLVRARQPISEIAEMVDALSNARAEPAIQPSEPADPEFPAEGLDETAAAVGLEPQAHGVPSIGWPQPAGFLEASDRHSAWAADPGLWQQIQEDDAGAAHSGADETDVLQQECPEPKTVTQVRPAAEETSQRRPENARYAADDNSRLAPATSAAGRLPAAFMSKGRLGMALVAAAALIGTGVFLIVPPAAKKDGAVLAAHNPAGPAANSSATAPAEPTPRSVPAAPGSAVENTFPAAVALSVSAPAIASASTPPAVPDLRPAEPAPVKSAATAPEPSEKVIPTGAAIPEGSAPAAGSASAEADRKAPAIVAPAPDGGGPAAQLLPNASAAATGPAADRPEARATVASLGPAKEAALTAGPAALGPAPTVPLSAQPEPESTKPPPPSSAETALLLERGDRLFGAGEIASARLFYERAADAGDAQAALRLGETYDPAFLRRAQLRLSGDSRLAVFWYRRAQELGAGEAQILLQGMQTR